MVDLAWIKIENVNRGDLLMVAGGFVIADTLSATGTGRMFWYDTDGERHYENPTDGTLTVGIATFRTQEHGQVKGGYAHALLNAAPGKMPQPYCPDARDAREVAVWSSGTALSAVNCPGCRRAIGLVNTPDSERKRKSTGI